MGSGLDLEGAVAAGGAHDLLTGQLVQSSGQRLTGMVANPIVWWASVESGRWWQAGRSFRSDSA